ncbi:hypothetical protein D3C76_860270 [compost metagenome]
MVADEQPLHDRERAGQAGALSAAPGAGAVVPDHVVSEYRPQGAPARVLHRHRHLPARRGAVQQEPQVRDHRPGPDGRRRDLPHQDRSAVR